MLLIDVTRLLGRRLRGRIPTGVDRVCIQYLRHFRSRSGLAIRVGSAFFCISAPHSDRLIAGLIESRGRLALCFSLVRSLLRWRRPPSGSWLLNITHSGLEHWRYPDWMMSHGFRPVYFIHDLIPISHPQYSREGEPARHQVRIRNALCTAEGILTNSSETLLQLRQYAERCGLPLPPAAVALLAPADLPAAAPCSPLPQPYFLVLGTIEGRKNHQLLLEIWRTLPLSGPRLVIVGQRGWRAENVIAALDSDPLLSGKVLELSKCSDCQLATWLAHARSLLFPSHVEGYGMPLAEALASGTPVIASNLPAFREIAGDIPDYLDSMDFDSWKAKILDYSRDDSPARISQLQRMRSCHIPTWEEHFHVVERFLAELT